MATPLRRHPRGIRAPALAGALLIALLPAPGASQTLAVGDELEEYLRVLQISGRAPAGSFMVRPFLRWDGVPPGSANDHPWAETLGGWASGEREEGPAVTLEPARLRVFANSKVPFGRNDGAVWQGRGLTAALEGGATLAWGPFTATLRPQVIYNQNQSFPLAPVGREGASEFEYPWRALDWPQRFGPDAFGTVDPGQSHARVTFGSVTGGVSTENLWWGPAVRNGIVMSNQAPGFLHGFLATEGPVDVGVGTLEARWIWGWLDESDWFDDEVGATPKDRFLTGAVLVWSPKWLEGLSVGVTRTFVINIPEGGLEGGDFFLLFQGLDKERFATPDNPTGDDERDQLASLIARWIFPESGFEVYGEWSRNDHSWDIGDFVAQPDHSQGYTLGLQKVLDLTGGRLLALKGELTRLERSRTMQVRFAPTYYVHGFIRQGYTQRGQILGAGLGPGGSGQYVSADVFAPWGRWGLFLQREVRDNDAYYDRAAANGWVTCCHDLSVGGGGRVTLLRGPFELAAETTLSREMNRYFQEDDDFWNVNVVLAARWRPR